MKPMITALVFLGMTNGLLAQGDLPKALTAAKRAYIVNAGAYDGAKDDVTQALKEWGRFTVVDSAALSDITITMGKPIPFEGMPMTITDSKNQSHLWRAAHKNFTGNRDRARALVQRLRDRLEGR